MFKKLLKYDMLSVWRLWWLLAVSVLGLSVAGSLVLRFVISNMEDSRFAILTAFGMFFFVISLVAIVASIALTQLLIYYRFYKNFFTDEGYLTFTLPVSRRDLLLSKTLNALIWEVAHVLLLVVCLFIFLLVSPPVGDSGRLLNTDIVVAMLDGVAQAWNAIGGWLIVYVLEAILILSGAFVFSASLIHFCITIGSVVAKKYKLLAAIGIYYLVNMLLSTVLQIVGLFGISSFAVGFGYKLEAIGQGAGLPAIALLLLVIALMVTSGALIMTFMTLGKLERKLNLA